MNSAAHEDNEITLFDLVLVISENIKLLVAGPLIAGILAFGLISIGPQNYVSNATISLQPSTSPPFLFSTSTSTSTSTPTPKLVASLFKTALIIDPIIGSIDLAHGKSMQDVRESIASKVSVEVDKAGLLQIEVSAPTAVAAQELGAALIKSWLESTKPSNEERQELEKRLLIAENNLKSASNLINQMEVEAGKPNGKFIGRRDVGTTLLALSELQARYSFEVTQISKALMGLSRNVVIQQPSLPSNAKKNHAEVLAALVVFFALLIFVFLRHAWRTLSTEPEFEQKKLLLLRSFGPKTSASVR